MDAIYRLDGNVAETSKWAGGPWNETQQHGSAPAALVAHIAEQIPTAQPMHVTRGNDEDLDICPGVVEVAVEEEHVHASGLA